MNQTMQQKRAMSNYGYGDTVLDRVRQNGTGECSEQGDVNNWHEAIVFWMGALSFLIGWGLVLAGTWLLAPSMTGFGEAFVRVFGGGVMSAHTPGPWELAEKYNCVHVRAKDGPYIADCNASAALPWEKKEANARLIAAAPDLLSAAYLMDQTAERFMEFDPDSRFGEAIAALRSAITKATGDQA